MGQALDRLDRPIRARSNFRAINGAAEFLLLSALHENAFPVHYWASLMDLDRLREVLVELIASDPYPERVTVPYVVGAFLWEERAMVLAPHASKAGSYAGYGRVVRATDRDGFLLGGRSAPENFELPSGATARITADVLSDVLVAGAGSTSVCTPAMTTSVDTVPICSSSICGFTEAARSAPEVLLL